jgi:hypothetical protein
MRKRGPIGVVLPPEDAAAEVHESPAEITTLPDKAVLDAGVRKFMEYAGLHWPATVKIEGADFKLTSFDYKNDYHLRVTLGMVYMAMKNADDLPF